MLTFQEFYLQSQIQQFESLVESFLPGVDPRAMTDDILYGEANFWNNALKMARSAKDAVMNTDYMKRNLQSREQRLAAKTGQPVTQGDANQAPVAAQQDGGSELPGAAAPQESGPSKLKPKILSWKDHLASMKGGLAGRAEFKKNQQIEKLVQKYKDAWGNQYSDDKLPKKAQEYLAQKAANPTQLSKQELIDRNKQKSLAGSRQERAKQYAQKIGLEDPAPVAPQQAAQPEQPTVANRAMPNQAGNRYKAYDGGSSKSNVSGEMNNLKQMIAKMGVEIENLKKARGQTA